MADNPSKAQIDSEGPTFPLGIDDPLVYEAFAPARPRDAAKAPSPFRAAGQVIEDAVRGAANTVVDEAKNHTGRFVLEAGGAIALGVAATAGSSIIAGGAALVGAGEAAIAGAATVIEGLAATTLGLGTIGGGIGAVKDIKDGLNKSEKDIEIVTHPEIHTPEEIRQANKNIEANLGPGTLEAMLTTSGVLIAGGNAARLLGKVKIIDSRLSPTIVRDLSDVPLEDSESMDLLLKNAPLTLSRETNGKRLGFKLNGNLEDPDTGRRIPVIVSLGRNQLAAQAYQFHKLTDFTSQVPPIVYRQEGLDVQLHLGEELDLKRFKKLKSDPQFRDQLEQATVERIIIGDADMGDGNNMTLSRWNDRWIVANIDYGEGLGAFEEHTIPWAVDPLLAGQPISQPTLDKVQSLVNKLESPAGRQSLTDIGLSLGQINALLLRARYLLEHPERVNDFETTLNGN